MTRDFSFLDRSTESRQSLYAGCALTLGVVSIASCEALDRRSCERCICFKGLALKDETFVAPSPEVGGSFLDGGAALAATAEGTNGVTAGTTRVPDRRQGPSWRCPLTRHFGIASFWFVSFAARCFHYVGPLHDSGALRFTVSDSPRSCPAFEFPYGFGESSDYPRRVRDGKSKSPGDSLQSSGECAAAVGVSFHRFPKDAMIYKKWIVAIKRDEGPEFQVGKSTMVCSKHFRSSDFIPSVASGRSLLRDSAVPSVFAFSKEKKERKPPKPRASPQVRSQNPVLGPGVLGDELMHSPDEVKAAPVGLEEPTRLNSSLEGENARLAETIKQKNNEITRLRDELCQIKEQLVAAKGIIGQLGFEKASLSCQLAAERERTAPFTVERFKDCDEDMLFYTGLPSYNHFKKLLVYLNPGDDGCNVLRSERAESSEPRSSRGRKRKLSTEN
ncbi:hypothetical protein HPB51_011398 [Rhipicephalus microplus]|uniref:THAP-type domain-containing protein n=1 Tax=Rhipicephalus microplus TaxID=6941 RepID=A0A9J6F1G1_RHIMP|nr:hypothetical protein HPB51_011398 [Rhipicephalus microplus]